MSSDHDSSQDHIQDQIESMMHNLDLNDEEYPSHMN